MPRRGRQAGLGLCAPWPAAAKVPFIISAILNAGGEAPVAAIEELVWEQVAAAYGYQLDDAAERRHVDRLVQGIFAQLADLGAAEHIDQGVRLTELGGALWPPRRARSSMPTTSCWNSSRQPISPSERVPARASAERTLSAYSWHGIATFILGSFLGRRVDRA